MARPVSPAVKTRLVPAIARGPPCVAGHGPTWQPELVPPKWFSVRCVFRLDGLDDLDGTDTNLYEERITVWRAGSLDEAIALAEADARRYAKVLAPNEYLGLAQAYEMADPLEHGAEVFS